MQTVILCGGRGLRLGLEGDIRPKALVEIGGRPVIWHVMRHFAHHGFHDFILCLGYKGEMIRDYFLQYPWRTGDFRLDLRTGRTVPLGSGDTADWRITFVDTGPETQTGGRLARIASLIDGDRFFATYTDGVSDLDLRALLSFHQSHGGVATVTGVHPPLPYGLLQIEGPWVTGFREKPALDQPVNGGYFVFSRRIFDYLGGDDCVLEGEPLRRLASERLLAAYEHGGFWACMDTPKDVVRLDGLWRAGGPWKVWDD